MLLNVFGKKIEVVRNGDLWQVFYIGNEGKKRVARDIVIPRSLPESEIVEYVADICHEWARPGNLNVELIDK